MTFPGQIIASTQKELEEKVYAKPEPNKFALEVFIKWAKQNKRQTVNRSEFSYGLKHRVEDLSRALEKVIPDYQSEYIANEELICAMVRAGFIAKNQYRPGSNKLGPNYYFNIKALPTNEVWIKQALDLL